MLISIWSKEQVEVYLVYGVVGNKLRIRRRRIGKFYFIIKLQRHDEAVKGETTTMMVSLLERFVCRFGIQC